MRVYIRTLLVTAFAAGILAAAQSGRACIIEFRSTDCQVAMSPLVVLAKVTRITPMPLTPEAAAYFPEGFARPTTATVAVMKVFKGPQDIKTLQISSGPMRSCAPYPVHTKFVQNQVSVFILSAPVDGVYQLRWIGSMRDPGDAPIIQDSVSRCDQWRSEYLHRIETQTPEIYHSAQQLDAQLVAAAAKWPVIDPASLTPAEILHGVTEEGPLKTAAGGVLALFKDADPAVVQTALAFDFGRPVQWSDHLVWQEACTRYVQVHAKQVSALQQAEWLRLLERAGGTSQQFDAYLARLGEEGQAPQLTFPNAPPPTPFVALRGANLTTDFLLRSQDFDRGLLYYAYGLHPGPLATLDPDRVKDLLPVMCHNANEQLRWAASTAISEIPGDQFVDVLIDEFISGSAGYLQNIQTSSDQDPRLTMILDHVQKNLSPARQALFWKQLAAAQCFSPACTDRARAASGDPDPAGADPKERAQYHAALEEYLKAAKAFIKEAQSLFPPQNP